jgi:hypothetical protein
MLEFRTLLTAWFVRTIAILRWCCCWVRDVRRGDSPQPLSQANCPVVWACALCSDGVRSLLVCVPWHDTSGGRDGPSLCRRFLQAFYLAWRFGARGNPAASVDGPSPQLI